jgi:acetyl-CoA carboxylase carboxyltransferase component
LLGCCDIIIATRDANIGMAGPAMIEGGGMGKVAPTEIGPAEIHARAGSVDVLVADEGETVAVALRYLRIVGSAGRELSESEVRRNDAILLRNVVPANRVEVYDVRRAIELMTDVESSIELRPQFGVGIVTVLSAINGRQVGIVANNPAHLGGAIDRDAADKMARFIQLCDAHRLPIVSLCDTPGFMVGAQAEEQAQVRHFARLFVVAASATVPWVTIVLRKGYGLGAQAMAGGGFHAKDFIAAWPTGEFGGMGIEGAVRLGFRHELAASDDPAELEKRLIAAAYERGSALSMASHVEIDDVIDPRDTPEMIARVLDGCANRPRLGRTMIDPW